MTTYGADSIWTSQDSIDWGGNSNLLVDVATSADDTGTHHGLWFNPTMPASAYSAIKKFEVATNAKVKYEVNWYFGNSTGRTTNYEYIQFGDKVRFSWNSDYKVYLTTDGASSQSSCVVLSGKGTYTKKIIVIFDTSTKKVEYISFGGTVLTDSMPSSLEGAFNSVTFGLVRGGGTSKWAYPNGIQDITVSQFEQTVTTAGYTINYQLADSTVKTVSSSTVVGETITADKAIDTEDGVHYLVSASEIPSMTISATEANNVLNVPVRLPYTATLKLTTTIGSNATTAETTLTETDDKVCSWSYAYSLYALGTDGQYYKADNTETFGESGTFTDGETISKAVTYTNADEDVVFFAEGESANANEGVNYQYSNGATGHIGAQNARNRGIDAGTVEAGYYQMTAYVTANESRCVSVRDATSTTTATDPLAEVSTSRLQTVSFMLAAATPLKISGKNSGTDKTNQSADFDYVLIRKYTPSPVAVEISSVGHATYTPLEYGLDFTDVSEIYAYKAAFSDDGTKVNLTRVSTVAVGEGVLLRSMNGGATSASVPVSATATAADDNIFIGVTADTTITEGYVLNVVDDELGFYKAAAAGTKVAAGRAYLPATVSTAKGFAMSFDDGGTTGIAEVSACGTNATRGGAFYSISGQRVAQPTKGLYILNGKKVVVNKQ